MQIHDKNDYYPFGMNHLKTGEAYFGADSYNKYNGKELESTGMYDYGARFYMPDLGRWGVVDPLAEKTMDPYGYVWNNPIVFIDPDGKEGTHDYKLNQNGSIQLVKWTEDNFDTLYATDSNNNINTKKSITINKELSSVQSIIGQLSQDANKPDTYLPGRRILKEGDVSLGQTRSFTDAANVYNFMNANTESNIEIGIFKYNKGAGTNYLITTQHSYDTLTKAFNTVMDKYVGNYNNLISFIHNHDGYSGSHPHIVGNQWESDQNTRRNVFTEVLKSSNMLPRFMTVHEGLGNTLIELNRNGQTKTNMQLTPATLKSINKIDYDNVK